MGRAAEPAQAGEKRLIDSGPMRGGRGKGGGLQRGPEEEGVRIEPE